MRSTKSVDLIGHIKFLLWGQLDGCSVTRPFLFAKGVACKTRILQGYTSLVTKPKHTFSLASHTLCSDNVPLCSPLTMFLSAPLTMFLSAPLTMFLFAPLTMFPSAPPLSQCFSPALLA